MVGKLHAKGMLVGDLALPNLAVSGIGPGAAPRQRLLRRQVRRPRTTAGRPGGTDNSPPEGGSGKHTKETDYFALAVVICQCCWREYHPFGGTDTTASSDDEPSAAANIERGRSWLFHRDCSTATSA